MGYDVRKRGKYFWMFGQVKGLRLDRSLRTIRKKEAFAIAEGVYKKALERTYGVRILRSIKFKELTEKYLAYSKQHNSASTYDRKRPFINHILAFFGDVPLSSITTERIEEFKSHRRSTVGPATVNREMADWAVGSHEPEGYIRGMHSTVERRKG